MKSIFIAFALLTVGCSIHYSNPSYNEGGGDIYRIEKRKAITVIENYLHKKELDGTIDSYGTGRDGVTFRIKGIESKVLIVSVTKPDGVTLDASGGGSYIAGQIIPNEFKSTMSVLSGLKYELEAKSNGVIRPLLESERVIDDLYP